MGIVQVFVLHAQMDAKGHVRVAKAVVRMDVRLHVPMDVIKHVQVDVEMVVRTHA